MLSPLSWLKLLDAYLEMWSDESLKHEVPAFQLIHDYRVNRNHDDGASWHTENHDSGTRGTLHLYL